MDEDRVVLVLQRVVERVVPPIDENIDVDDPEGERDDHDQQPPGGPAVLRAPIGASQAPGIPKQLAQASVGRLHLTAVVDPLPNALLPNATRPAESQAGSSRHAED